jgi:hypothetical protein
MQAMQRMTAVANTPRDSRAGAILVVAEAIPVAAGVTARERSINAHAPMLPAAKRQYE